ncbi:hypothetical protein [Pseudoalteromonas ardens]|nr:hypothetical protein [Pseudoalteromonas sp. R96]MDK1312962.1 hypothetical protein [Pseudoalteromonas sp. R96]
MQLPLKNPHVLGALFTICTFTASAGNITELKVDGNTVLFKTSDAKSHTVPECVTANNKAYWAIDLHTLAGQAKYSTLVTAMSAKAQVTVTSAQACLTTVAAEQVQSIAMVQPAQPKSGFAGVTPSLRGDFAKTFGLPALFAMDKQCDITFPGSRAMLWDDYRSMHGNYPDQLVQNSVIILDPVEHISYSRSQENRDSQIQLTREIYFKNGQRLLENSGNTYTYNQTPFCLDFTNASSSLFFYNLHYHRITKRGCHYTASLACVY